MKTLPLSQGYVAIVDDSDYALVSQWKWHAQPRPDTVYAFRNINIRGKYKGVRLHRLIMGVTDPKIEVDHIDGDGLNNTRANLRLATKAQNQANSRKRRDGKSSRFKGVSLIPRAVHFGPWYAYISDGHGSTHSIGHFATELGAAAAYNASAYRAYGSFARLNDLTS